MKFKLDENLSHNAAEHLRKFGHDVSTVRLQGLAGTPDDDLFRICVAEGRALITLDRDFGETLRFSPSVAAGIVILELGPRPSLRAILDRLTEFAEMAKIYSLAGALWIVEPGRVRIHLEEDKP